MNIEKFINKISKYSDSSYEGITRLPFTAESKKAFQYIINEIELLGLDIYSDKYGTVQGHLQGESEDSIIIASHYDSVKNGGKYDGIVGIAVGLAVIDYFKSNNIIPNYSIDILALNDEEGVRFNQGFLSSKAITETLDISGIYDKESGTKLSNLLKLNMYGSDLISLSSTLKNAKGYIEVHIEQGKILEDKNCDLGIVDNIVGLERFFVTIGGSSGHAGTTPMEYRSDALVAACKIITDLQNVTAKYENSVLTIGSINVNPNAINVIPDKVVFSIDARTPNRNDFKPMWWDIKRICTDNPILDFPHNNTVCIERSTNIEPISLINRQTTVLEQSIKNCNVNYIHMNSGAGHDSQVFADFMPTSMLFVPSVNGYSHRPDEYTDIRHIENSVKVLCNFLKDNRLGFSGGD